MYYIFLDDDIEFVRGDWREFEALLLKYMPAIATPRKGNFDEDNRLVSEHNKIVDSQLEAQVVYSYDAMFNSFHRDVVFDSLVLPYIENLRSNSLAAAADAQNWSPNQKSLLVH